MKVLKVLAGNLKGNRSAVLIDLNYTPYAIVTNLDVTKREGEQWDSAYNYYNDFISFIKDVIEFNKEKENDIKDDLFDITVDDLCKCAKRENKEISEDVAEKIIGYMEGHDYQLLYDNEYNLFREDIQDGDDICEYSMLDVVNFILDMNTDLIESTERELEELENDGFEYEYNQTRKYLNELTDDKEIFEKLWDEWLK